MNQNLIVRASTAVVLLLLACATIAPAQSRPTFVKGAVTQGGKPARSVWVIVSQSDRERSRALTGDDGKYYIGSLEAGSYDIVVLSGTRQVFRGRVTLPKNSTFDIRI